MKIRPILSAVIFLLVSGLGLRAQSRPELIKSIDRITTEDQLGEWLTYYYLHPRPDLVVSATQLMSRQGRLQDTSVETPFCVFLSHVFATNEGQVGTWSAELRTGPEDQKKALALGLWMAGTSSSQDLLKSLSSQGPLIFQNYVKELLASSRRPDFLHDEISNPGFLDALWVSFFASGDERYVKRVINALQLLKTQGDTGKILIGGAAKWSLASNAFQHPKVMQICEAELKELPDEQRATLAEVIQSAKDQKK